MANQRIVIIVERDFAEVGNRAITSHLESLHGIAEDSAHVVCEELAPALLAAYDGLAGYMDYLVKFVEEKTEETDG